MSEEELINKLCNKFAIGDNYDSRYTDDIYNSIIDLDQYKNNWEELKKWIKEQDDKYQPYYGGYEYNGEYEDTLNKMKELEEDK